MIVIRGFISLLGLLFLFSANFDWPLIDKIGYFDRDTILLDRLYDLLGRTGFRIFIGLAGAFLAYIAWTA